MAKKNRNKNSNHNHTNEKEKSTTKSFGAIKSFINKAVPVAEGISPLQSDVSVLEQDPTMKKQAETALQEIQSLLVALQGKIKEHSEAKGNYDKLSEQAANLQAELKCNESELNQLKNALDNDTQKLKEKERVLNIKETEQLALQEEIDEQRSEAEAGFVRLLKEAIEKKSAKLLELENEHNKKLADDWNKLKQLQSTLLEKQRELDQREADARAGFIVEREDLQKKLQQERQRLLDEINVKHKLQQDNLDTEVLNIEKRKLELESDNKELKREQQILEMRKRSQQEWELSKEDEIRHHFSSEISSLQSQLEQERQCRTQDQEQIANLQKELIKFKDLERSLNNANIEDVQAELAGLRQQNKELKERAYISDAEDLEEKCEILEERVHDQQDTISDLRREYEETQAELHKIRLSTAEKHNLAKEKRVLELHNRALDSAVEGLQHQLDDLIEKHQGSKVFPALSSMDQKHRRDAVNIQPIPGLKGFAEQLRLGMASVYPGSPLYYQEKDIRLFLGGLAMSNLHILQGMSGTGKTSLAKAFAKVVGGNCTDIAVQAGWRDKDDLIGHYNAFEKKFYEREALQALYRAQLPEYKDRVNIILLDEMNLSRPEQYFAEFLSAMEKQPGDREIVLVENEQKNAPNLLKEGRILKVPENVWFIGTANHDETTNEFADKTYDRSHVMELVRNADKFNADAYEPNVIYSYKSMQSEFDEACNNGERKVTQLMNGLIDSELRTILENSFDVSWGNRLERHALRFIPVVKASGGTIEEGLDHLLATKIFRQGKVTGRFDISGTDLDAVSNALKATWKDKLKLEGEPIYSLSVIEKDRKRLERGA
ncbi:AAA family ATPase [Photobacterium sp. J15]|uniref:AAA family ATPase n=1 Tax=Photobacterium sp. J15 TaxID=265901 RepID=UPI0007E447BC|nr:AAA family ATPase [Photobacterium sp. J15]